MHWWSKSSLGPHVIRYIFEHFDSFYVFNCVAFAIKSLYVLLLDTLAVILHKSVLYYVSVWLSKYVIMISRIQFLDLKVHTELIYRLTRTNTIYFLTLSFLNFKWTIPSLNLGMGCKQSIGKKKKKKQKKKKKKNRTTKKQNNKQ